MQKGMLQRYLEIEQEHWWFTARREIILSLMARWVPPGGRILDVGCGTGYLLKAASEKWDVWGIDTAPEAVTFCRSRGLERVQAGSMETLDPAQLPRFDAVCFFDVLEHLDDDVAALRTAASLLTDRGVVLATVPAYQWLWSSHDVRNHHRRRYTGTLLNRTLNQAGLSPALLGYFNSRLFPLAMVDRVFKRLIPNYDRELLPVPPRPLNNWLRRVLLSENARLTGAEPRTFRFGLSIMTVARLAQGSTRATGPAESEAVSRTSRR